MPTEEEKQKQLERAKRLEQKLLFVKAAEVYLSIGMKSEAAAAFERVNAFDRAIELYTELGKTDEVARCKKKREESSVGGQTWDDVQADFQSDRGNPY